MKLNTTELSKNDLVLTDSGRFWLISDVREPRHPGLFGHDVVVDYAWYDHATNRFVMSEYPQNVSVGRLFTPMNEHKSDFGLS